MEKIYVTSDVTTAMALVTAGFHLRNADKIVTGAGPKQHVSYVCEFDDEHNGLHAGSLVERLKHGWDACADRCNEIISARDISESEYSELAFIESAAGLYSRKKFLGQMLKVKPLVTKDAGDGRNLVFREGVPGSGEPSPKDKEQLAQLLAEISPWGD